jgi:hypothetical protein
MVSLDAEQCQANVGIKNDIVDQKFCSKEIMAADWNKDHSIIVQAREEEFHFYSATYKIELYVEEHFHHPVWGNYRLPDVIVFISILYLMSIFSSFFGMVLRLFICAQNQGDIFYEQFNYFKCGVCYMYSVYALCYEI